MKVFSSILIMLFSFTVGKSEAGSVNIKPSVIQPASVIFNDRIVSSISTDNSSSKEDHLTRPVKEIRQLHLLKYLPSPQGYLKTETVFIPGKPVTIARATCCISLGLLLVFPQHYFW